MKYVGNLKKNNVFFENDGFDSQKAVFPPGSIIPDAVSENSQSFEEFKENFDGGELFGDIKSLKPDKGFSKPLYFGDEMPKNAANVVSVCGGNKGMGDFLSMYIGKKVSAEFLFGADTYAKKTGTLIGSGLNFFVLKTEDEKEVICDLTDIKFITLA